MSESDSYIEVTDVVPFQTSKSYQMEDLSSVQSSILPVSQNVKGEIKKASIAETKNGDLAFVKLELSIVDGIPTQNSNGDIEYRYRNKTVFPGMLETIFWADKERKTSQWYKDKQHLVSFKQFCQALGLDTTEVQRQIATVPDDFLTSLIGRQILFSIKHEPNTSIDSNGVYVPDGTFKERIYGWKKSVD